MTQATIPRDDKGRLRAALRVSITQIPTSLERASEFASMLMFAGMFAVIVLQVTMRYVFNDPLSWSEEIATIALIWTVFWTNAVVLRIQDHVTFDLVYQMVSDKTRRVISIITTFVFFVLFLYSIPMTIDYFIFLENQYTASLEISFQVAFFTYFVFAFAFPARLLARLLRLLSPTWRDHL